MIKRHIPGKIHHRVVEHGDTVYIGGLVASDKSQDMRGQAEQIFVKLDELLALAGTHKGRLLSVTIHSAAFEQKDSFNAAWVAWLDAEHFPVRAYLGGAVLTPDTLVEVTAIAAK